MKYLILFVLLFVNLQAEKVVVTIHGYMTTHKCMHRIGRTLRKEGCIVYHFDYPSLSGSISESSRELTSFLKAVNQQHPECEMNFVTYSLGGIVLRTSVNDPSFPESLKHAKVVMLAPPNQGSQLGKVLSPLLKAFGRGAGRELARRDFSDLGEFPPSMQVTVIAGTFGFNPLIAFPNDGKVALHETFLKTPHKFLKMSACHTMIMRNPQVIAKVVEEINAQSFNRSDCILGNTTS
ncbi:MAG: alpha/beta hydrolase [Chlamydiales bacterium]